MPKPIQLDEPCEVCGKNEWWDNRETKKSPKMPDWKCANKECRTESGYPNGRWLPKGGKLAPKAPVSHQEPAGAPKGGRLTPDDTTPDERGERVFTWQALTHTYSKLYAAVYKVMDLHAAERGQQVDQSAVQAGVATLLIQGEKAHIPLLVPRKVSKDEVAKPAKPVPEHIAEDFEDADLPF